MGLDISAYRRITKLDAVFDADGEPINPETREPLDYHFQAGVNPNFPDRAEGVEDRAVYRADDSHGFHAGSYGGYNAWRENLAKLAGYPSIPIDRYGTGNKKIRHDAGAWESTGGPFWELIFFSDCEGVIGPVVSAKLAKDFAEFDEQAKAEDENFYSRYQEWRRAFEMAADGGAVEFH